jgi:hypothetical protein
MRGQDEQFWQAVFVAAIQAGKDTDEAAEMADEAVGEFQNREGPSFD